MSFDTPLHAASYIALRVSASFLRFTLKFERSFAPPRHTPLRLVSSRLASLRFASFCLILPHLVLPCLASRHAWHLGGSKESKDALHGKMQLTLASVERGAQRSDRHTVSFNRFRSFRVATLSLLFYRVLDGQSWLAVRSRIEDHPRQDAKRHLMFTRFEMLTAIWVLSIWYKSFCLCYSLNVKKDRMMLVLTCVTKRKAPIDSFSSYIWHLAVRFSFRH